MGCWRFETKNVQKLNRWNSWGRCIKSYVTSAGRYAPHGKRSETGQQRQSRWKRPETNVDGQDLTICGGRQGYMDFFFWGILCCNYFFFLLLLFLHTKKHQDGKHYQRLKERTITRRPFPKRRFRQSAWRTALLNFDIWEGDSPSPVKIDLPKDQRGGPF